MCIGAEFVLALLEYEGRRQGRLFQKRGNCPAEFARREELIERQLVMAEPDHVGGWKQRLAPCGVGLFFQRNVVIQGKRYDKIERVDIGRVQVGEHAFVAIGVQFRPDKRLPVRLDAEQDDRVGHRLATRIIADAFIRGRVRFTVKWPPARAMIALGVGEGRA